jgi:hypothetical protein
MPGGIEQRHVGSARRGARLSAACIATGLTALLIGAAPAGAHSDTNAGAASICGPGYFVVDDPDGTPARRAVRTSGGAVYGHVYLLFSNASGKNCVVTIKSRFHGTPSVMYAGLRVQGRSGPCGTEGWFCDQDAFSHFAGGPPRYKTTVSAAGRCVQYLGAINAPGGGGFAEGGRRSWWNCGG